nr:unnamed protein product [Digitaria exilis]
MKVEVKEEIPEENTVGEAVTEYERRRQENIRRNEAILAELRRDAATVSAAYAPARRKRQPRTNPEGGPAGAPRRSGRARRQPPPSASVGVSLPSELLRRRPARLPISEAYVGEAATVEDPSAPLTHAIRAGSWPAPEAKPRAAEVGLDPSSSEGAMLLRLEPWNVRKLTPTVMTAAPRVLPLADRTVVAVGTDFGHLMFWDATSSSRALADGEGMFWYPPHTHKLCPGSPRIPLFPSR